MIQSLIDQLDMYLGNTFFLSYIAVYLGGVVVSFTPCVYPVIPITVAYIAAQSKGSRARSCVLSVTYVSGMAVTYTALGIIAALTGTLFGRIQANPWTYVVVANICILLGLSMLDVFTLPLPGFVSRGGGRGKRRGLWGAFLIGAVSGFVVGPCTAPVLAVLLTYVASQQDVFFGTTLLFVFAFGMGTTLIVLGTFSGLVANMPRAGRWMNTVKKLCGGVLIAVGEYFLVTAGILLV